MKDKRKILLGTKDVLPQVNNDVYINLEIRRTSDELQTEIVNNDFNLRDQFNTERRQSLKFCVYGTLNSIFSNVSFIDLEIKTNHEDLMYIPRIESNAKAAVTHTIQAKPLSKNNKLSKNIFNKDKSSFYFLFELSPGIKNFGETKTLEIKINSTTTTKKVYAELEIPFLFFDDDKNLIDFGNDTASFDLNGEEQIIENDFPFLYGTHWIKNEISLPRPLFLSLRRSQKSNLNNLTVQETAGTVKFIAALDFPSIYGIEKAEIYIKKDETQKNPNDDFYFEPKKLSWDVGEQFKEVTIDVVDDLFVEGDEKLLFGFRDIEYAEESDKNTFELTIQNDDTPSILTFENGGQEIISTATTISTFIITDKPVKVPNQTIDLILDQENSTIIIGEDIENTGTEENPEYRKTIDLTQGLDLFEIEISTIDNLKYDFTKTAIFKFDKPTQNIAIGNNLNTFTLTIKDSMVKRFTKYIIDNDKNKGQGIFRLRYPTPANINTTVTFVNTNSPPTGNHIVTNVFPYVLSVVNDGETIIYEDRMVSSGETIFEIPSKNGYDKFEFNLPSNHEINSQGRYFEKSKYKVLITEIGSSFGSTFGIPPSPTINTFEDVEIQSEPLESSFDKSGKTYYLTSELYGVRTRLERLSGGFNSKIGTYNLIIQAGIAATDGYSLIKQKLRDTGLFPASNTFPFGSSGSEFDEQKIAFLASNIKDFISENPTLKPIKPFEVRQIATNSVIDCKINGIMILNKLLTSPNTNNFNPFFNPSNIVEPKVKVLNARFEESPVVYTYFPEEKSPIYFTGMPVEPINS